MATEAAQVDFTEGAAPGTPAAATTRIYAKADGLMYSKDDAGTETLMSSGTALSNPMTTAGDIIKGGAAGVPERLAMGSALQVLRVNAGATALEYAAAAAGGVASGTSNPGGPASGDLFFRTDLDFLITYDGTQWVTVQEYAIAGQPRVLIDGATATSLNALRYSVPNDYDIYVVALDFSTLIATTNGSNYWQADLNKVDTANTGTSIGNATTAADTGGVWARHKIAIAATLAGATYPSLSVSLTKVASPSGIFIASATLRYRLIVT